MLCPARELTHKVQEGAHRGTAVALIGIAEEPVGQFASVAKQFDEPAVLDCGTGICFENLCDPVPGDGRLKFLLCGAQGQPPVRHDLDRVNVFCEGQSRYRAARKPSPNAIMPDQIGDSGVIERAGKRAGSWG